MKLEELQRLAEGATPGSWWHDTSTGQIGEVACLDGWVLAQVQQRVHGDHQRRNADAAYIAAMSPDTAKKLIAVALAGVHAHAEMARWSGIASGEGFWDAMNTLGTALEELK